MELYQLEYLRAIVEAGSMHAAAAKLHVAQSSLSRCMKSLEQELGCPLFDRVGRNIVLNAAGEIALNRAVATLDAAASIKRDVDAYVRCEEQTLNLYAPVPMGDDERLLCYFKKLHPEIRIRIGVAPTKSLLGEVPDITFFAAPIVHEEPNYLKLAEERVVLAVPEGSPLADKGEVALADMRDEKFVLSMPGWYRDMCDSMFVEVGFEPRVVFENQSYDQLMRTVAMGAGYALVPSITWFSSARSGVVGVPLSDVRRTRYLYLKRRRGQSLSGPAKLFSDYLVEHYREVSGGPMA